MVVDLDLADAEIMKGLTVGGCGECNTTSGTGRRWSSVSRATPISTWGEGCVGVRAANGP